MNNVFSSHLTKDEIKVEAEALSKEMLPRLKEIIRSYENGDISYREASARVEEMRSEFSKGTLDSE